MSRTNHPRRRLGHSGTSVRGSANLRRDKRAANRRARRVPPLALEDYEWPTAEEERENALCYELEDERRWLEEERADYLAWLEPGDWYEPDDFEDFALPLPLKNLDAYEHAYGWGDFE